MYHSNKKLCVWERPEPHNIKIWCIIRAGGARKFSIFQCEIAVQRHYFMVAKIMIFLPAQKWGGQALPTFRGGGSVPRPPGCYAYDTCNVWKPCRWSTFTLNYVASLLTAFFDVTGFPAFRGVSREAPESRRNVWITTVVWRLCQRRIWQQRHNKHAT